MASDPPRTLPLPDPAASGTALGGSFRDPSGFVFRKDGVLYRQVNPGYRADYDALVETGLLEELQRQSLLVAHEEVEASVGEGAYKVLRPHLVPFVSYPFEWCFGQLRRAALLTLDLQERALARKMTLKDASAFNVQFEGGRAVFIDTLSFERYVEGQPWVAYRQFCQHFLAPLALMRHLDSSLVRLLGVHLDGVPLPLASRLLPWWTRLSFSYQAHLHLHASAQRRAPRPKATSAGTPPAGGGVSLAAQRGLLDSLRATLEGLRPRRVDSTWGDYYDTHLYSPEAFQAKQAAVTEFLDQVQPRDVWDLGANEGVFSRLAADRGVPTVAFDLDHEAVQRCYEGCAERPGHLLPLVMDFTNPSPALGWAHRERDSLQQRGPADLALALALVHHLAIGNNVPLAQVAAFLATTGRSLVVEFVPKDDPQVVRMLASRRDVFPDYSLEHLEQALGRHFRSVVRRSIAGSGRVLLLARQ